MFLTVIPTEWTAHKHLFMKCGVGDVMSMRDELCGKRPLGGKQVFDPTMEVDDEKSELSPKTPRWIFLTGHWK